MISNHDLVLMVIAVAAIALVIVGIKIFKIGLATNSSNVHSGRNVSEKTAETREAIIHTPPIQNGLPEYAIVDKWRWITIMNMETISNSNITFEFKETAGIEKGGIVRMVNVVGDYVLVKYQSPVEPTAGTRCPSGALFFLSKEEYASMSENFREDTERTLKQMSLVNSLTNN